MGRGATVDEVVLEVNRLPFAHVGFNVHRNTNFNVATANTWTLVPLNIRITDTDALVNAAGTQVVIADGCDGVWILGILGRGTGNADASMKITVNGVTVATDVLFSSPYSTLSVPTMLNKGDVIQWWVRSANLFSGLVFEAADNDDVLSPQVHGYRVGLLP